MKNREIGGANGEVLPAEEHDRVVKAKQDWDDGWKELKKKKNKNKNYSGQ